MIHPAHRFISCDWGSTAFRLRLVDADRLAIEAEITASCGIVSTFEYWKQSGKKEEDRFSFYAAVLNEQLGKLGEQVNFSLQDLPLVVSGMAASRIGMMELPYKGLPFSTDGRDLNIKVIKSATDLRHPVVMISGVQTSNDVMRGEETQLVGCMPVDDENEQLFIFPGTHSKHVKMKKGKVVDLATYMTGEFFGLLSSKSILADAVEENESGSFPVESFEKGVMDSVGFNLLNSSFSVRTSQLFGRRTKRENYYYLSGLLIGSELKGLTGTGFGLTLVSNEPLTALYGTACSVLGIAGIKHQDAAAALVRGHCQVYKQVSAAGII